MASKELYALLLGRKSSREQKLTEDHILSILCFRRARDRAFGDGLFSDPAWDILLELYAAKLGDRAMSETELAQAIHSPLSVVRRWVAVLRERQLICAVEDRDDESRQVRLSSDATCKMAHLADHWGPAFLSIR